MSITESAILIEKVGKDLEIRFQYDPEYVERVKRIPGREFQKIWKRGRRYPEKFWTVPLASLPDLAKEFPKATYKPEYLEQEVFELNQQHRTRETIRNNGDAPQPEHITREMFNFQRAGAAFASGLDSILFADQMGLGKTIQSICWASEQPEGELKTARAKTPGFCRRCGRKLETLDAAKAGIGPVCAKREMEDLKYRSKTRPAGTVVVCPASLKYNWKREIELARPGDTVEIVNSKISTTKYLSLKSQGMPLPDWVIINYDILWRSKNLEAIHNYNPNNLIIDECHFIKNESTNRSKAVLQLAAEVSRRAAISGTPIVNKPAEIWPTLLMLGKYPKKAKGWFLREFCMKVDQFGNPIPNRFSYSGYDYTGARNLDKLHELLQPFTLRRLKKDVLKDLPDKIYTDWLVDISKGDYQEYVEWFKAFKEGKYNPENRTMEIIAELSKMRRMLAVAKVETIKERLQENLENQRKILVFSSHLEPLHQLSEHFKGWSMKIEGADSATKRQEAIDLFQNNPTTIFAFLSTKAAGVGLTLTAADQVLFIDLPWTPADKTQAEDRCHRIGQTKKVEVVHCIAVETLDEDVVSIIERKAKIAARVLDGVKPESGEDVAWAVKEAAERRAA